MISQKDKYIHLIPAKKCLKYTTHSDNIWPFASLWVIGLLGLRSGISSGNSITAIFRIEQADHTLNIYWLR